MADKLRAKLEQAAREATSGRFSEFGSVAEMEMEIADLRRQLADEHARYEAALDQSQDAEARYVEAQQARERAEKSLSEVDDVLVVNWVGPRKDGDYRRALHNLVTNAIREYNDPRISEVAAKTIQDLTAANALLAKLPMSNTERFRKKPVVVEAMQWNGENLAQLTEWGAPVTILPASSSLIIGTLEDGPNCEALHVATLHDWIIKGVKGEFYPCKPDIFAATYEPVAHLPS